MSQLEKKIELEASILGWNKMSPWERAHLLDKLGLFLPGVSAKMYRTRWQRIRSADRQLIVSKLKAIL